jgi:hypothetical protein
LVTAEKNQSSPAARRCWSIRPMGRVRAAFFSPENDRKRVADLCARILG